MVSCSGDNDDCWDDSVSESSLLAACSMSSMSTLVVSMFSDCTEDVSSINMSFPSSQWVTE